VDAAIEYKTANAALLGNEVARLEVKPVVRTDILAANRVRLATINRDIANLRAAGDIADTRPEPVAEVDGVVIQGRVTDANGRGLLQTSVQLSDSRGRAVEVVEPVRTDGKGSYFIRINAQRLNEVSEALGRGATLVATIEHRDIGSMRSESFPLERSAILVPDIVFALDTDARPTTPGRGFVLVADVPEAVLTRPVLTPNNRLRTTSGRISPLLRTGKGVSRE
jgi:hypothetical protein